MANEQRSIKLQAQHIAWIETVVARGEYADESAYVQALLERDEARHEKFLALKSAIQEGIDSGLSDRTIPDIMSAVEERVDARKTV